MFKISTSELKKHKKISAVFDGGLQRICVNDLQELTEIGKIFKCFFFFLQKPNLLRTTTAEQK